MRDILDTLSNLFESTGLAGRKSGDVFKNEQGDELTFDNILFFPEGGGRLNPEQLDDLLASIQQKYPNVVWQNSRTAKSGGVALISFNDSDTMIGRYLEQVKPNVTDNYVPNTFTIDGATYKFGGKAAEKTQAGLTPQDLLKDKIDLSVTDIMNQLSVSLGTDHPLYAVAHEIAMGTPLPLEFNAPADISFTAFRDYFCEILQPIALQKGQYTGNAGEASARFLGGSYENTAISFDDSKTAGLSDSVMTTSDGRSVLISSKGGKGATASVSNLLDKVEQLEETPEGKKFLSKYDEVVGIIKEIKNKGQAGSPLYLGIKFGVINAADAQQIVDWKKLGPINMDNISKVGLSKNLEKLAKERSTDNPNNVNLYYHLIAAVAHKAIIEVNEKTDFPKAAADILNNGALVQVYTKATQGKEKWTLKEFDTVYPGESIKGVYLSASKTYYSTGIKGNFTFRISKDGSKPKDEQAKAAATSGPSLKTRAEVDTDTKSVGVGRAKRR